MAGGAADEVDLQNLLEPGDHRKTAKAPISHQDVVRAQLRCQIMEQSQLRDAPRTLGHGDDGAAEQGKERHEPK